jgi:hypothetical protein
MKATDAGYDPSAQQVGRSLDGVGVTSGSDSDPDGRAVGRRVGSKIFRWAISSKGLNSSAADSVAPGARLPINRESGSDPLRRGRGRSARHDDPLATDASPGNRASSVISFRCHRACNSTTSRRTGSGPVSTRREIGSRRGGFPCPTSEPPCAPSSCRRSSADQSGHGKS